MKRIKGLLIFFISMTMSIAVVKAAPSYSFNVSSNTIDEGKSVTASVTVKSTAAWNFKITSSGNTYGCSNAWADATGDANNTTKTFSTTCRSSSIGTIVFSLSGDITSSDGSSISLSGTKSVRVKEPTPASTINSLKSLSVEGYEISPEFSSDVLEYSTEVPSSVKSVKINATKTDTKSSVDGIGEKEVDEGINKFEIVVTAENGDKRTYILNVNVKDLNPINIVVNNANYSIIKNTKNLDIPDGFTEDKMTIDGQEVPVFKNNNSNITLVALKDEKGNIKFFKYENGKYYPYISVESTNIVLYLIEKDSVPFKRFNKESISINNENVSAFKYKNLNNYYLVYGMDLSTGKEGYYLYDKNNNTFQVFDEELFNALIKDNTTYLYMLIGSLVILFISIIIIITLSSKKKTKKVKTENKENDNKKLDLLFDDIEEPKKTKKKKGKNEI